MFIQDSESMSSLRWLCDGMGSMLSEAVILITFQFLIPKPFRLHIA